MKNAFSVLVALSLASTSLAQTVDQQQPLVDLAAGPLAIGGSSEQVLDQTVTSGASGTFASLRFPVAGTASEVSAEVREFSFDALGTLVPGALLSTATAASLPLIAGGVFQDFTLATPVAVTPGRELLLVLRNVPGASASITPSPNGDSYAGGQGYFSDLTNGGQILEIDLGGPGRDDLPFRTVLVGTTLEIDARPADPTNTIFLPGFTDLLPVAVLSSASFDATAEIAADSVQFGVLGREAPTLLPFSIDLDVNFDGRRDALFLFRKSASGIAIGSTEARLTADLVGGGGRVRHGLDRGDRDLSRPV
ncbi:MAG: hypothetical protein AAGI22_30100 [Planctomycetota bacterium]